jgi:hypothetical protein
MVPDPQLDSLIATFYANISGPAGTRDWSRERDVYHPDARLMPPASTRTASRGSAS